MKGPLCVTAIFAAAGLMRLAVLDRSAAGDTSVPLLRPLDELPRDILGGDWRVRDVPLEPDVLRRARVDAYLQRHHTRGDLDVWLYVGYVGRWSPESIHHPAICFPASGYELVSEAHREINAPGVDGAARFKELCWRQPGGGGTYTLTTFYYNGKFEPEELRLRWDSLAGVPCFTVVTLSGEQLPTLEATRELYAAALSVVIPALRNLIDVPAERDRS